MKKLERLIYFFTGLVVGQFLVYLRMRDDYLRREAILYLQNNDLSIFSGFVTISFVLLWMAVILYAIAYYYNNKSKVHTKINETVR